MSTFRQSIPYLSLGYPTGENGVWPYVPAKPKHGICSLYNWADAAFWLCRSVCSRESEECGHQITVVQRQKAVSAHFQVSKYRFLSLPGRAVILCRSKANSGTCLLEKLTVTAFCLCAAKQITCVRFGKLGWVSHRVGNNQKRKYRCRIDDASIHWCMSLFSGAPLACRGRYQGRVFAERAGGFKAYAGQVIARLSV